MKAITVNEILHVHIGVVECESDGSSFVEILLGGNLVLANDHLVVVKVERDLVGDAVIFPVGCSHRVLSFHRWECVAIRDELNVIFTVLHVASVKGS